ncbi:hypothetical protein [Planctomyces sp. SH-PL14]|uniref:hypothetical protein n=1 Tax=Planctomyces sp. SH-PL14 TaxID=1632864 RepID=UPI00078BA44C|nr:hypothetical protein [Planctomyces sp. SH-PL14]AMV21270.1 hypothetical protein VT03_25435 [Planctomyces sp. SH-PL14]
MSRNLSDERRRWFLKGAAGLGILLGAAHLAADVFWMKFNFREHPTLGLMLVLSPCLSFLVLGLVARSQGRGRYLVSMPSLCFGAAVGVVINVFTIWMELIEFLTPYNGGGANIGMGLLLLGTPIFTPPLMFATVLAVELAVRSIGPRRPQTHS